MKIAETLDTQGEIALAADVRYFAQLPPMLTHKTVLATHFVERLRTKRQETAPRTERPYDRTR